MVGRADYDANQNRLDEPFIPSKNVISIVYGKHGFKQLPKASYMIVTVMV